MKGVRRTIILLLGVFGFLISAYLFHVHGSMEAGVCNINSVFSCNSVDQSAYSEIFGVSVSALGMLFYLAVIAGLLKRNYLKKLITKFMTLKTYDIIYFSILILGVLFGVYLTFIEAFVIKAYCIYCLTSFAISTLLLILFYYQMKKTKYESENNKKYETDKTKGKKR